MSKKIQCIVVEDNLDLNRIYTDILNYEPDIEVMHNLFSGEELMAILLESEEGEHPDVILLDIEMETPKAGIEYCKKITERFPNLKIVILTCFEEDDKVVAAFEAGAVDYILKTSSMAEVILTVRNVFHNKTPIHSFAASAIRKRVREFGKFRSRLKEFTLVFSTLTPAEIGILKLHLQGLKQREIAELKHIELVTVKSHAGNIIKKFKLTRMQEVIVLVKCLDLVDFVYEADPI